MHGTIVRMEEARSERQEPSLEERAHRQTLEERAHDIEHHARERVERFQSVVHSRPKWWQQVIFVGVLYALYTLARNLNGRAISIDVANRHALDVVHAEKWLHIFNEQHIQKFFLDHSREFVHFLNIWYGTAHFVVTIAALLIMYFYFPHRYTKWRNVIFGTTAFALVGYIVYPLAPPRFLPASYGFVDTVNTIGGWLTFNNGAVQDVSNQYAAMPSLHAGWSTWCAFALIPIIKPWWGKLLMFLYPCLTILTIVTTANHYWMDVFGGWFVLLIGFLIATVIENRRIKKLMESNQLTKEDIKAIQM